MDKNNTIQSLLLKMRKLLYKHVYIYFTDSLDEIDDFTNPGF